VEILNNCQFGFAIVLGRVGIGYGRGRGCILGIFSEILGTISELLGTLLFNFHLRDKPIEFSL